MGSDEMRRETTMLKPQQLRRPLRLAVLALIGVALVVVPASAAPGSGSTAPALAPLSQAALIHDWFTHLRAPEPGIAGTIANLRAAAVGHTPRAVPGVGAAPLAADVFNHDTVGLPQNEESVTACGRTVLGGTNDFRGLLLNPPQSPAAGWHLSTDGGQTVRIEGLLPPVTVAGRQVPALGDPVDVAGQGCSLYASSVNSTPDDTVNAIVVYRSRPHALESCSGGTDAACWPTRRAVATAAPPHFLDKEWMDVGRSGSAGEVVWVSFTDFIRDAAGTPLSSSIKAVRCNPELTTCTRPILVSGSDRATQFSDVTVGPAGRTYLSWVNFEGAPDSGQAMVIKLRVAPRGSTRFGPTRVVATETKPMVGVLHANSFIVGATTIPKNDVKMVHGRPSVFVVWEGCLARPFGVVCEEPRINLARSVDSGASWARTVLSIGGDNYYPTISEDRGGKALAVAWYTNRHDRLFHSRQDVELASVDPSTGAVTKRQRLTPVSNETDADPVLLGQFIGDYFEVFAQHGVAYVHYNANYRFVPLAGRGLPVPQQDNYLTEVHI
jgi:hypothetical protein